MKYSNRPLVQALVKFKEAAPFSLHVPGHKNGILTQLPADLQSALQYDFTELTGLDDLHNPESVLKEAQHKLASLYRADHSFFLVNGSTVGNLAMIYAVCKLGDVVIVQRNAHQSIFHAIELTGATPIFVSPSWDSVTRTAGTLKTGQIEKALKAYPKAKAVILTYPTYYGVTGEGLQDIIHLCHKYKVPVLVDEAHGAHFVVGEPFPDSALGMGADVVVHSAHKTLPAMTMASFLHVRSDFISPERIAYYLYMLQSSSPSYLLMASLDDAREYVESYTEIDKMNFMKQRLVFIERLKKVSYLQIIEPDDPLKLMIRAEGYSGFFIQQQLEQEGVYAELADPNQILLVLPLLKTEYIYPFDEICNRIERVFTKLEKKRKILPAIEFTPIEQDISRLHYSFGELRELDTEWIPYEKAVGAVAAASIIPYPPGIPLLLGGELIKRIHVQELTTLIQVGANFQGVIQLKDKKILVVKKGAEE